MVNPVFRFLPGNKSPPESALVKSATAGLIASARWSVEPASGFLWYCHLLFLIKVPTPEGEQFIYFFPQQGLRVFKNKKYFKIRINEAQSRPN